LANAGNKRIINLNYIEKYHLNDLKQDVANSNAKYRKYLYEMIKIEKENMRKKKVEKDQLIELKNRLKFD